MVLVVCWPAGLVFMFRERQAARLALFLCRRCTAKWRWATIARWLTIGIGLAGLIGMVYVGIAKPESDSLALVTLGAIVGGLAGLFLVHYALFQPAALRATTIDKTHIWVAGFHPRMADRLAPPWGTSR